MKVNIISINSKRKFTITFAIHGVTSKNPVLSVGPMVVDVDTKVDNLSFARRVSVSPVFFQADDVEEIKRDLHREVDAFIDALAALRRGT